MQTNLFTTDGDLFKLDYTVETTEDITTIREIKYYEGLSPFGNYAVLLAQGSVLELELSDNIDGYIEAAQTRYPDTKFTQVKNWDLGKKLFTPAKYNTVANIGLQLHGTPFQLSVWNELLKIPFGETVSYDDIALRLGDKNASRAVGTAVGQNKIAFLVPCHRVVAKNGKLSNFRWGVERKRQMLNWEYENLLA
jgi:AraC family transcriptional regulator, regulatory protein of adaptative response / methylated-DNA-[protein]-cysteine methyltransferase